MNLTINDKDYPLTFGLAFLDFVDNRSGMKMDVDGQEVNTGIAGMGMLKSKLATYSPTALVTVIKGATATERQKPSNKDIEAWMDDLIGDDNGDEYYNIYDEIVSEMGKSRLVKVSSKGSRG